MKRLPKVRQGLARLRLFRSTVRLGVMGSTVLSILLWALAAAFVLDYWIGMDALERSIVLVGVIAVAIWTVTRFVLPAIKVHESDAALAVLVDAKRGLHSNLVAAIEFDDDARPQYGSDQLREKVVENTGRAATGMDFLEGFSRQELMRRLLVFVATVAICLVPSALYSAHAGAFLKRLMLGDVHYPTQTKIEDIQISSNGRVAEGSTVTFTVRCSGVQPKTGEIRIVPVAGGSQATISFKPYDEKTPGLYLAEFPRVLEDMSCTIVLGDAYPEQRTVTVVALPRVTLKMEVEIPSYVSAKKAPEPRSRRQAVVPEGSKVIPVITADKELTGGTVTFEKGGREFPLTQRGKEWVLDDPASDLARVTEMTRFEVKVRDVDALSPANAIRGTVEVSDDLMPRVALMGYSRRVLPTAAPRLRYYAEDDHALDHLSLHVAVMDADGMQITTSEFPVPFQDVRRTRVGVFYTLPLAKLTEGKGVLQKGAQVLVTLEAVDYRGEKNGQKVPGKSRVSEKWIFEVSDQQGVLEGMELLTEQMDKKLDEVIRAQVEAGK